MADVRGGDTTATNSLVGRTANRLGGRWDGTGHAPDRTGPRVEGPERDERLASFLGWFSIGLGLTQVVAPRDFARFIGARGGDDDQTLMRPVGLRELACGVGILTRPRPAGWVWARVAGDAMDLALLGGALASGAPRPDRVAAATVAVLGVTALDVYDSLRLGHHPDPSGRGWEGGAIEVRKAVTVNRPAEGLYRFWHDFQNLPRFMNHLESVQVIGERRSHWKAKAPAGMTVEWDAEVTDDRPNELIAWRSLPGSGVDNSGSVRFTPAPGGRGTEVHVEMRYSPPLGAVGAWIAKLFGEEPDQQVYDDLRALKQLMETGEVVRSDATAGGGWLTHPARPTANRTGR